MPLYGFCLLLAVSFLFSAPTYAVDPTDEAIEGLSRSVEAAEKAAADLAQSLKWRRAEFSKSSYPHNEEGFEEFLAPKGIKANDCSFCHEQSPDSELKKHVSSAFDLRMKLQRAQLADAMAKLEATAANLDRRESVRDKIIQRRVDKLALGPESSWLGDQLDSYGLVVLDPSDDAKLEEVAPESRKQNGNVGELDATWAALVGLNYVDSNASLPQRFRGCVKIIKVVEDSPAAKAGVKPNDLLIGINGWETINVTAMDSVLQQILTEAVASPIKFYVVRNGQTLAGKLTLPDSVSKVREKSLKEVDRLIDEAIRDVEKLLTKSYRQMAERDEIKDRERKTETLLDQLAVKIADLQIERTSLSQKSHSLAKLADHDASVQLKKIREQMEATEESKDSIDSTGYTRLLSQFQKQSLRMEGLIKSICGETTLQASELQEAIELMGEKEKALEQQLGAFQRQFAETEHEVQLIRKMRADDVTIQREIDRNERLLERLQQKQNDVAKERLE
jgi:hypothetical protein